MKSERLGWFNFLEAQKIAGREAMKNQEPTLFDHDLYTQILSLVDDINDLESLQLANAKIVQMARELPMNDIASIYVKAIAAIEYRRTRVAIKQNPNLYGYKSLPLYD